MSKIKFTRAPVVELICGIQFDFINNIFPLVSNLYKIVKSDYPTVEEKQPMAVTFDIASFGNVSKEQLKGALIRYWLVSKRGDMLIQLQNNRFFYNWRKNENELNVYPHFEEVYSNFKKFFDTFLDICVSNEVKININQLELTYLDHINPHDFNIENGLLSEIYTFYKTDTIFKNTNRFNITFSSPLEVCGGHFNININSAIKKPTEELIIVMDSTIRGMLNQQVKDIDTWFKTAHDCIGEQFLKLTTQKAKTIWQHQ